MIRITQTKWNLERAVQEYLDTSQSTIKKMGDITKLGVIFDSFLDPSETNALDLGRFFDEIKMDGAGIPGFVLAWKLDCKTVGVITKQEFVNTFSELRVDTLSGIANLLDQFVKSLKSADVFREMYKWVFKYLKGPGLKKTLEKNELLFTIWPILLPSEKYPLTGPFFKYMESIDGGVSLDLWNMTFEFVNSVQADLSNYDAESGAWPTVIDNFVISEKKKLNK